MALWHVNTQDDSFRNMERQMSRLFDNFLTGLRPSGQQGIMFPKVDLHEDDKHYYVNAEIPGVRKENIKLDVRDDSLYICAETKQKKEFMEPREGGREGGREGREGSREGGRRYSEHYSERSYGRWERMIKLPGRVEHNNVKAKYEDGVLEITCPKAHEKDKSSIKVM